MTQAKEENIVPVATQFGKSPMVRDEKLKAILESASEQLEADYAYRGYQDRHQTSPGECPDCQMFMPNCICHRPAPANNNVASAVPDETGDPAASSWRDR